MVYNEEKISTLAIELAIILRYSQEYYKVQTVHDFFEVLEVPRKYRTDSLIAEIMREVLIYPAKDFIELPESDVKDYKHYVEIPVERLYTKSGESGYKEVEKLAFIKLKHYVANEEHLHVLPYVGEEFNDSHKAKGKHGLAPWIVSMGTIKKMKDISSFRNFMQVDNEFTTEEFVVGDNVHSFVGGVLCNHGSLELELRRLRQ